jgi:hypothetical protein
MALSSSLLDAGQKVQGKKAFVSARKKSFVSALLLGVDKAYNTVGSNCRSG